MLLLVPVTAPLINHAASLVHKPGAAPTIWNREPPRAPSVPVLPSGGSVLGRAFNITSNSLRYLDPASQAVFHCIGTGIHRRSWRRCGSVPSGRYYSWRRFKLLLHLGDFSLHKGVNLRLQRPISTGQLLSLLMAMIGLLAFAKTPPPLTSSCASLGRRPRYVPAGNTRALVKYDQGKPSPGNCMPQVAMP